jgi:putative transcriptional regulator
VSDSVVGRRIREERLKNGMNQTQLAEKAGIALDTVSTLERGEHSPRPSTMRKLARALGMSIRDLYEDPAVLAGKAEAPQDSGQVQPVEGQLWVEVDKDQSVAEVFREIVEGGELPSSGRIEVHVRKDGTAVIYEPLPEARSQSKAKITTKSRKVGSFQKKQQRQKRRLRRGSDVQEVVWEVAPGGRSFIL